MESELRDCFGCLSHKKTPDGAAYRRQAPEQDEDLFMLDFGDDFKVDALQKIAPSKAFRRMSFKTQVLTATTSAHIRNRQNHTYEVANIATSIARVLGLNESLCLAIALGHDIGHAPFGHAGEGFLSEVTGKEFRHELFGLVIAQHIERQGQGLNLTHHVLEGILNHSRGTSEISRSEGVSEEASVVMYADKIAYIWCDINDIFERTKIMGYSDFPEIGRLADACGSNQRERFAFCIKGLCHESAEKGYVSFEESEAAKIFSELKRNMYEIYELANLLNGIEILKRVYGFLSGAKIIKGVDPAIVLALMTDADVLWLNGKQQIGLKDFQECSVAELIGPLRDKDIDFLDPDLNW